MKTHRADVCWPIQGFYPSVSACKREGGVGGVHKGQHQILRKKKTFTIWAGNPLGSGLCGPSMSRGNEQAGAARQEA